MEWCILPLFFVLWVLLGIMWGLSVPEAMFQAVGCAVMVGIATFICFHAIQ